MLGTTGDVTQVHFPLNSEPLPLTPTLLSSLASCLTADAGGGWADAAKAGRFSPHSVSSAIEHQPPFPPLENTLPVRTKATS